ncbi:heme exporter protein CcmB [Pseudomonadota bacterium]
MDNGSPSLRHAFISLLRRDLILAYRRRSEIVNPLLFFVIVICLFPLGVTPESATLRILAPGIVWVAALLATLISLDGLFRSDFEEGALEQMLLSPHPTSILMLAKILAHWLITGLPLILVAPLLAMLLYLPDQALGTLLLTLIIGTPVLSLVGAIGVALTVGLSRGGILVALLTLPLFVPVLIFGANAVNSAASGLEVVGQIYALCAMLALALTLAPLATAAALRISLN